MYEHTLPSELLGTGIFGMAAVASSTCSTIGSGSSSSAYSKASLCFRSGEEIPSMCSDEVGVAGLLSRVSGDVWVKEKSGSLTPRVLPPLRHYPHQRGRAYPGPVPG